jgi:HD-like signal output (HDOD) protein
LRLIPQGASSKPPIVDPYSTAPWNPCLNPYLEELLARPTNLPTIPSVVRQVMETFGDENVSLDEVSRRITLDPVITAKLLRLANSAFYRTRREVSSVDDALQMLGMTTVRNVVLGCGLKDAFAPIPGLDLPGLWRHGVQTACGARWLGRALGLDAELGFTVGLMQGIGQLVLHKAIPERVSQISALVPVLAPGRGALELRALHFHFGDVAAALAQRWNLPPSLVATLAAMPLPHLAQPPVPVAACVHLASWCAWRSGTPPAAGTAAPDDYPEEAAAVLGLHSAWWPASLDAAAPAGRPPSPGARMPAVAELTQGLEELMT